jgi:glycosyltransferase involved in cell wall biosynthesis
MISVIICTYNPIISFLEETIQAINNQSFKVFELIIVDNNSKFKVANLDVIERNPHIRVIFEGKPGLTAARWAGARNAKNDILVFVDDDNVLEHTYLENAYRILTNNLNIGMLSGRIMPRYEKAPKKWFYRFEGMIAIKRYSDLSGLKLISNDANICYTDYFPIGAGMVVQKRVMEEYYSVHLVDKKNYIEGRKGDELSSAEDIDFAFFCLSKNLQVGVTSDLELIHIIPKSRTELNYLLKLSTASLNSCFLVNKKWYHEFDKNVFKVFNKPTIELILRVVFYSLFRSKGNLINKMYYKRVLDFIK